MTISKSARQRAARESQRRYRNKNREALRIAARDYARRRVAENPERNTAQSRRWRAANPKRDRALNRRIQHRKMDFVREVLGTECVDCPEDRPEAIQYHHPHGREYGHKHGLSGLSWARLKDEIMLMIPLCATCHLVRHRLAGTLGQPRIDQEVSDEAS